MERQNNQDRKSTAEHTVSDQEDFAQSNVHSSLFKEEMERGEATLGL
jgi:hypothetical protein